jgi:signal transduction histidine kinase
MRLALRYRIVVVLTLSVAVTAVAFVLLGGRAVKSTENSARDEILVAAAVSVAEHVDDVIARTVGREEHLAQMVASSWSQGEAQVIELLDAYPRFLFESDLFLVRPPRQLVWSMSAGTSVPVGMRADPLVAASLESGKTGVGPCVASGGTQAPLVCFASPVSIDGEDPAGVLLAIVDLGRPEIDLFSIDSVNRSFRIELVSSDGLILATNGAGAGEVTDHVAEVMPLLARAGPEIAGDIQPIEGGDSTQPFGFAPLSRVSGWGVVVEPKALGTSFGGGGSEGLLLFALAVSIAAVPLAYVAAGRLLKPLRVAVGGAKLLAEGGRGAVEAENLSDEVGDLEDAVRRIRDRVNAALVEARRAGESRRQSAARGKLLAGVFERHEDERQKVFREIHEGTVQSLAALAMGLDSAESELSADAGAARDRMARARALTVALLRDLRQLASRLRPLTIDHLGLIPAVRSYAEDRLAKEGVRVAYDVSGMPPRLSPTVEVSLYRVAQDAIDNIGLHARATVASIALTWGDQGLALVIEDDGRGFDAAEVLADPNAIRGIGILSMQERMAFLGGTFKLESTLGQGTRVCAEVPLDQEDGELP